MNAILVEQKIAFYQKLVTLLEEAGEFNETLAEELVSRRKVIELAAKKLGQEFFVLELSKRSLLEAYNEHFSVHGGLDCLGSLVETAFFELARHMRDIRARRSFNRLRQMVDLEKRDLFIRKVNTRCLSRDSSDKTVVTLVVDNADKFEEFLRNKSSVERVRYC